MWNTSAARLRISVHSSGPGIAQRLYFPAASGCPPTTMSLLRAIVVAVSAPGHHTLPTARLLPARRASGRGRSAGCTRSLPESCPRSGSRWRAGSSEPALAGSPAPTAARTASSFLRDYRVPQHTDPGDLHFDHVAGRERPHAGGRSRSDQVSRLERHDLRDEGNKRQNGKHHVGRAAVLALLAVDPAHHLELVESARVHGHHAGPDGAERVEPLRPGPLLLGPLQVPRGDVVDAGDPGDARARLAFRGARPRTAAGV